VEEKTPLSCGQDCAWSGAGSAIPRLRENAEASADKVSRVAV